MGTCVLVLLGLASYMVCVSSLSSLPLEHEILDKRYEHSQAENSDTFLLDKPLVDLSLPSSPVAVEQQGSNLVVEATFVFDKTALQKFTGHDQKASAKKYVDNMLGKINFMFDGLKLGLKIGLRSVEYLDHDLYTSTGRVTPDTALTSFRNYLSNDYSGKNIDYDLAILFTGYAMSGGTIGYAYKYTVCWDSGYNAGVVQFGGKYNTIITAAHEIGHIIGCDHDKLNGYVMAGKAGNTKWWAYSSESRKCISNHIAKLNTDYNNCLKNTNHQTVIPKSIEQCQDEPGYRTCAFRSFVGKCTHCKKSCGRC